MNVGNTYTESVESVNDLAEAIRTMVNKIEARGGQHIRVEITPRWGNEHFIKYSWKEEL